MVVVFHIFARLYDRRTPIATIAAFAFYLTGPVNSSQWEPDQEIASALFTVGFFLAWGFGRRWIAIAMVVFNVAVREDCGMLLALPLFLLWAHDRWLRRDTGEGAVRPVLGYALCSALLSVIAFTSIGHRLHGEASVFQSDRHYRGVLLRSPASCALVDRDHR